MFTIKNTIVACMLVFCSANSFAQQKNIHSALQFHSINNIGLLEGESGSAFQLQTINGFQYKSWFGGFGLGLDFYKLRTIPLFIDLRKEFGKTSNKFFLFADAGINFYWEKDSDFKQFQMNDTFKNGIYGEAGAGYKLKLTRKFSVAFSGGYSYKKLIEEGSYGFVNPFGPESPQPGKINYNLNRLVLKAGIVF
jgi:hypothetical protein